MKKITLSLLFGFISFFGFSQIGLVENFDLSLALPAGWTGTGYSGSVFQQCNGVSVRSNLSGTNTTADLISLNLVGQSNGTDLTVTFDYKIVDWSAAVDATPPGWGELNVQYSTNNGGTWTTMGTVNDANHVTANTCANMSFVLPAASIPNGSDFKLRFENTWSSGDYYFYIDNVTATQVVVNPPSCVNLTTPLNGATGVAITTNLAWEAATGIPTGYTLTVGTTPGGTDIVNNLDVGLSTMYDLPDLEYSTTYYVTILPYNANGPAVNCQEQSFTTGADPNAPVDCGSGIPINTVFCYTNNDNTTFSFISSDGSPLVVVFNSGSTENNWDELIVLDSDGVTNINPTPYGNAGNLAGLQFVSSGDTITVGVTSDGSGVSCTTDPWDFDVFCVDTTALPNCNASLTDPLNGAAGVSENTDLTWSAASVFVTGYTLYMGTTPGGTDVLNGVDVGNVLTYNIPTTLDFSTTYYVTIIPYNDNGNAINCNEESFTTRNDPNQIIDCSISQVVNTVHCYDSNENEGVMAFNFASNDGSPLYIVFNSGQVENTWDELFIVDSDGVTNLNAATPYGNAGDLTGLTYTSTGTSLTVFVESDGIFSCQSEGYVPWNFDVGCVDTTALPNCNASLTDPLNGAVDINENNNLTWSPATVFVTGYTLYMGTSPGGTDVLNGVDVGNVLTYDPGTLDYATTYYVTIIPYNTNGDATNCTEESFTTRADPNQIIDCPSGQILNTVFCYENGIPMWTEIFSFQSSDGSPLNMFFNSGTIETCCDTLRIEEGDGTLIYEGTGNAGDFAGMSFFSTTDRIVMFYEADGSISCSSGARVEWDFDVSCFDPTAPPNCNADIIAPADGAIDVPINSTITWSPASIVVTGYTISIGTTPGGTDIANNVDVGNVLTYNPGILTNATFYYVTITPYNDNGPAQNCTEQSFKTICIPHVVTFNAIGDCDTDPNNPDFVIEVNVTDLVGSASIIITDDQGSANQTATAPGIITMGPYAANTVVTITTIKSDDDTCDVISSPITFICPPPPNPCSIVYAGEDVTIGCEESTDLTASFHLFGQDTSTYIINGLDTCPLPSTVGGTPAGVILDDSWSDPIDIGFEFCFFGDVYAELQIGGNGVLRFDVDPTDVGPGSNGWAMGAGDLLPNNTNPTLAEGNIFGVGHDIDPAVCGDINYLVVGTAPYRQFVVNYNSVCHFSCNELMSSSQIILYESSNNIDVNVFSKPTCNGWNGGRAVIGVQNNAGDIAFTPPGRNTGVWTVTEPESWRFAPSEGTPNYTFEWLDGVTPIGNTETITVSPIVTTTYTASVTYELCTGGTSTVTDDVTVTVITDSTDDPSFTMDATCDGGTATITGTAGGAFQFSPDPGDGAIIDPDTGTVTNGTPGETYNIQYVVLTTGTCPATSIETVTVLPGDDASFITSPTCDGGTATITGTVGGTFSFDPDPGDGAVIDPVTGTVSGGTSGASYTIMYTTNGTCPSSSTQTLNTLLDGGIFMEDFGTGTNRVSTPYTNYTFNEFTQVDDGEYALNNNASDLNTGWHDMQDHTVGDTDGLMFVVNASNVSGEFYRRTLLVVENSDYNFSAWITTVYDVDTFICPGTGVPANVTFRIENLAGNLITEINTGDIQNESNPNWQEYQLNFNTLANTQIQLVLLNQGVGGCGNDLAIDDINLSPVAPVLSFTADCLGGTTTVTGSTGGVFSFNPVPSDGAIIDATTGTITNGTPGATYTIEYTVLGGCITTDVQATLLPAEDASFILTANCTGATVTLNGNPGGTFIFNPVPTDGATIDSVTGEITNGVIGATYTVEYTTVGPCPATSSESVTIAALEDASFTLTATCDGGTADITGDTGGTFAFNPVPTDGATIDSATGEITNGTPGATYTVEYTTAGSCPSSSTQMVTVHPDEDASFSMTPTCNGATATIFGDLGGTFSFNPLPTDGAVIDPVTGEITNGVSEETYSVEYTTSGPCPETGSGVITLLASTEIASFDVTPTCDGATVIITGDLGGTFALNPLPLGGAVINSSTGEVTGGAPDTYYTIEYTTSGPCPVTVDETFLTDTCVIPEVITPNGDGKNDYFDLSGFDVNSLEIFNRNGIKIYSRGNYLNEFNGISDNGDELPTGTYFYVMRYRGNEVRSAWLYINREK